MKVQHFFDLQTSTLTYVVYDEITKDAIVIDPVLNYEPQGSKISFESINLVVDFLKHNSLNLHYVFETHVHADHLTGAYYLKKHISNFKTAIHENVVLVQKTFKSIFNFDQNFDVSGNSFDVLLKDEQVLKIGSLIVKVLHTPGHTPACISFLINDRILFTGDSLFMPDYGTGRCDFPLGSAKELFNSISKRIYTLPDDIEIFVGHDYQPNGRELMFKTTVSEEKRFNVHLNSETNELDFISFRNQRDKTLMAPKLLLASLQVNLLNGQLPKPEKNGVSYLKIPIKE